MYLKVWKSTGILRVFQPWLGDKKHFWIVDASHWLKQQCFDIDRLMVCMIEVKSPLHHNLFPLDFIGRIIDIF